MRQKTALVGETFCKNSVAWCDSHGTSAWLLTEHLLGAAFTCLTFNLSFCTSNMTYLIVLVRFLTSVLAQKL